MRKILPYFVFAILSIAFGLALEFAIDFFFSDADDAVGMLLSYGLVTPVSLIVARRFGKLGHVGTLLTAAVLFAISYWVIIAVLDAIARPAGGSVGLSSLVKTVGWSGLLIQLSVSLLVPVLWLAVLRQRVPGFHQAGRMQSGAYLSLQPKPFHGPA